MSGSAKQLRAGRVVQIRLNPKDCMTVVDIVTQIGAFQPGMSFSQATIIAFACMSETFRKNSIVPDREGFEYTKLMAEFPDTTRGRGSFQYQLDKSMRLRGPEYTYPAAELEASPSDEEVRGLDPEKHPVLEVRQLFHQLQELAAKREVDPINFSQEEYKTVEKRLLGLMDDYERSHPRG